MAFSSDLLDQAKSLARREPRRPKQASLRRSVSGAYYALYHTLVADAAKIMLPGGGVGSLRELLRRAFQHSEMKRAARSFAGGTPSTFVAAALGTSSISPQLRMVANAFVDLQEARHEADYDLSRNFTRRECLDLVERAEKARAHWIPARRTTEGRAFLVSLLTHDRLSRR